MKILNERLSPLTNSDVEEHLKKIPLEQQVEASIGAVPLATVKYEILKYFETSSCKLYKSDVIVKYLNELRQYNLTEDQYLMLANNPPKTQVQIHAVLGDQISDEDAEKILEITAKIFKFVR